MEKSWFNSQLLPWSGAALPSPSVSAMVCRNMVAAGKLVAVASSGPAITALSPPPCKHPVRLATAAPTRLSENILRSIFFSL